VLADRLARGEIDVGLIPTIELARISGLEVVPGLGIVSQGPARSVLLVCRRPLDRVRRVGLDPESRTTNALTRVLFDELWNARPEVDLAPLELEAALRDHDAVVRIGDKALFEPLPKGVEVFDLGEQWDRATGLPFVYAVWACRAGVLDARLRDRLQESMRRGVTAIDAIADEYRWRGRAYPDVAREYLTRNLRFRLGPGEIEGMKKFLGSAARLGIVPAAVEPRFRRRRRHDTASGTTAGIESGV